MPVKLSRLAKKGGNPKSRTASSEAARPIPPITLPRAGAAYAFVEGRLVVDGVVQSARVG